MKTFSLALALCLLSFAAHAFTQTGVIHESDGWQVNYTFAAPNGVQGSTNIFISKNTVKSYALVDCDGAALSTIKNILGFVAQPCVDPAQSQNLMPVLIGTDQDALDAANALAGDKETAWIASVTKSP